MCVYTTQSSYLRPRREKTESDIVLRHSEARRSIRETLEARRKEVETQFAKEADFIRRRNSKPIEIHSLNVSNISAGSQSIDGDEFSFIQVTLLAFPLVFFFTGA